MDIKSQDGKIRLQNITGVREKEKVQNLTVVNDYGHLTFINVQAEQFSLVSENGDVDFSELTVGNMNAKTGYGDINGKKVAAHEVNIRLEDGTCIFDDLDSSKMKIKSSYGVELNLSKAEEE